MIAHPVEAFSPAIFSIFNCTDFSSMKIHFYILPIAAGLLFFNVAPLFAQQPIPDYIRQQDIAVKPVYIPPPAGFENGTRTATFNITYTGYTPEAQAAFQYAADIWGFYLISDIPIKINTYFAPLVPGLLGITLPNGRKDFPGAPKANTWYSTSLANAISGTELNPGEFDVDLFLNSTVNWYFGTDGNCPATEYDFASVALHEICHGLGFVGLGKVSSGIGSFGLLQANDFAPIATSFPWPDLDTLPAIFDEYLEDGNNESLITLDNPSVDLKTAFTGNALYWNGNNALANNGNIKPRLYAPGTFSLGSSLLHLNESTYPAGNINELMTPFSGTADAVHDPGPIVLGMLKDIGWNLYLEGVENTTAPDELFHMYPNPVNDYLSIKNTRHKIGKVEIFDATGRSVLNRSEIPSLIDVSGFPEGIYFIRIAGTDFYQSFKFSKN